MDFFLFERFPFFEKILSFWKMSLFSKQIFFFEKFCIFGGFLSFWKIFFFWRISFFLKDVFIYKGILFLRISCFLKDFLCWEDFFFKNFSWSQCISCLSIRIIFPDYRDSRIKITGDLHKLPLASFHATKSSIPSEFHSANKNMA